MDEKMALLTEVNKLLATIPGYQLTMSMSEIEYGKILITDKGYISRISLEYGKTSDVFLGETYEEAIKGLAHEWIVSYIHLNPHLIHSKDNDLSTFDRIERFYAHCNFFINKARII